MSGYKKQKSDTDHRIEYGNSGNAAFGKLKMIMSSVKDIEEAVLRPPADELAEFRSWFAEFEEGVWDRRIEEDAAAGRLDSLADEAIEGLRKGRCTDR